MRAKAVVLVCLALLVWSGLQSCGPGVRPPVPACGSASGWSNAGPARHFTKHSLFNYIDGGAELFLEFGFAELTVQRYAGGGQELAVETYRMESPEAALGIYLMRCGEETPVEGVSARNSGDAYQLTVVKGSCFVQVNNFGGDEKLVPAMVALVRRSLETVPEGDSVTLFALLPPNGLIPRSELIVRGQFALQPIFTFGSGDVLQLDGRVFGVVGDYETSDNPSHTLLVFSYPTAADASSAYRNLGSNLDARLEVLDTCENGLVFKDSRGRFGVVSLDENVLEIRISLSKKPGCPS
ncbi:MAG: DUF6599 family protein [Candidatus Eisenbacteria bacterium]